ncbi:hypothetical protein BaRGS_00011905 [Batillaria attramentaria]|uniref:Uncharacterized protein n=1 Tax=Batillaria attramentaria TaxID=370345 RepID=A0ABD0LC19_9CAEN
MRLFSPRQKTPSPKGPLILPSLQRGEAFIETGQSQVLSLEGDVAGDGTSANTSRRVSQAGTAGSAAEKDQDGKSDSPRETSTSEDPTEPRPTTRKSSSGRKEGNATVEFYDEEVGLTPKKDDGGFTPQSLSLPLEELADKNETDDNDDEKGDAKDEDDVVDTGTPREDDVWNQVRKSRYIRGYDPPEMLMPAEPLSFVFNGKYTHSE